MGLPLPPTAPTSLHPLEGVGLQRREEADQPLCRGPEGAVGVHATRAGGPGLPIEAPRRHRRVERGCEGRDQELPRVQGQAGAIQALCGALRHVGESSMRHRWCLRLWEAQYTINRDNLNYRSGCKRYRRRDCQRTFNDLTGTLFDRKRSLAHWILATFLLCLSCSSRRIAKSCASPHRLSVGAGGCGMPPCPMRCTAKWRGPWKRTTSITPRATRAKPKGAERKG